MFRWIKRLLLRSDDEAPARTRERLAVISRMSAYQPMRPVPITPLPPSRYIPIATSQAPSPMWARDDDRQKREDVPVAAAVDTALMGEPAASFDTPWGGDTSSCSSSDSSFSSDSGCTAEAPDNSSFSGGSGDDTAA